MYHWIWRRFNFYPLFTLFICFIYLKWCHEFLSEQYQFWMPVVILSLGEVMNKTLRLFLYTNGCTVCPISYFWTISCFGEYFNPIQEISIITILDNKKMSIQFWFHCMICFFDDQVVVGEPSKPHQWGTRYSRHAYRKPATHQFILEFFDDSHGQADPGSSRRWHWGEDQQPLSGGRFGQLRSSRGDFEGGKDTPEDTLVYPSTPSKLFKKES